MIWRHCFESRGILSTAKMSTCIVSALIKQANLDAKNPAYACEPSSAQLFYQGAQQCLRDIVIMEVKTNHLECVRALLLQGNPKLERILYWKPDVWETAALLPDPGPMFCVLFGAKMQPFQHRQMSKSCVFRNLLQKPFLKLLQQDKKRIHLNVQVSIHAVPQVGGAIVDSLLFQKELEMIVQSISFGNMSVAEWLKKEKLMIRVHISSKPTRTGDGNRTTAFSIDLK